MAKKQGRSGARASKGATALETQPTKGQSNGRRKVSRKVAGNVEVDPRPASTSSGNPDRLREQTRRQASDSKFRTNLSEEDRQSEVRKSSRVERESSKGKGRTKSLEEVQGPME